MSLWELSIYVEMYALAAKRRDTREVGQACRGTLGKYAKHIEDLKAFITKKGGKKNVRRPAAPQKYVCTLSRLPFQVLCNIHAAQERKADELTTA